MPVASRLYDRLSFNFCLAGVLMLALLHSMTSLASEPEDSRPTLSQLGGLSSDLLNDGTLSRLPPALQAEPAGSGAAPGSVIAADQATVRQRQQSLLLPSDLHSGTVLVPINMSQVIHLDGSFGEVSIGNPEIADVVPLNTSSIYVFGKAFGTTSLTVTGERGEVMAVVDLVVSFNLDELKKQLHELVPGQRFEVRPAHDGLVLSGQVASAAALDRALAIANRFAPDRVT
ncbi:MAG: pilus assembly protein N-terminal domain-containing protein, partial [Pseudomonadota bacterium]